MKLTPLTLSIVTTTLISGVAIALAWTGPTGSPFSNNTAAPVNVGGVDQTKSGGLGSNGFVSGGGLKVGLNTMLGSISFTPRNVLEVNGNITNTAALNANSNLAGYNLGVGNIGAQTIYGYGSICTGNAQGDCSTSGGVVIGASNTQAGINIANTGNSFFNTGNLGVGNNNPGTKLNIGVSSALTLPDGTGVSYTPQILNVTTSGVAGIGTGVQDGTNNRRIGLFVDQTNGLQGISSSYSSGNIPFVIRSAGTENLRIDTAGNVGIGTTTPAAKLAVQGGILAQGTIRSGTGGYIFPDGTTQTTAATGQWTTSGANIYNANAGNVGIGTTNPANAKLEVIGAAGTVQFRIGDPGNPTTNFDFKRNNSTGALEIQGNQGGGVNNINLAPTSGNVGVGGDPTGAKLQVFGNTILTGTAGTSYFSSGAANYIRGNTYFNGSLIDENDGNYYVNPASTSITNDLRANIFYDKGDTNFYLDPAGTSITNSFRASVFYDRDNTIYYVNPESTSNLNVLTAAGNITSGGILRSNGSGNGYVEIGSLNSSWAHLITDRPSFYTNAPISVNGSISTYSGTFAVDSASGNVRASGYIGAGCEDWCETSGGYALLYANGNIVNTGTIASTGGITSGGVIRSTSGGFQFPDNSIQTTAAPGAPYRIWQNWSSPVYGVGIGADNTGAWERRYGFMNSTGSTYLGGFGGYGGAESLSSLWIGTSEANSSIKVTPSNKQVLIDTANGSTWFGYNGTTINYLRGNSYFNGSLIDEDNGGYYLNPAGTTITNDLRANILYDQGDTNFYLDPAGTSITNSFRASVFYDRDNTGYYLNPASTSNINEINSNQYRTNSVRSGLIGVYDAANTQAVFAMGDAYKLTPGGSSTNYGNFYGIGWSYNPDYGGAGNNPQSKAGLGHQALFMQAGVTGTAIGNGIWSNGIIHSASGGFRFPDGTTQTTAAGAAGSSIQNQNASAQTANAWVNGTLRADSGVYSSGANGFYSSTYIAGARNPIWRFANADGFGLSYFQGTAGTGGVDTIGFHFGTATAAGSNVKLTANGVIAPSVVAETITTNAGSHLSYSGTTNYLRGNTYANGVYYDENNSAYYVDPASTSIYNDLRANIFYDAANTGYYTQPASTSRLNAVRANYYDSPYSGSDSGLTGNRSYQWGYQEGGAWSGTYPDLILGYHTGVKMGANAGYGGVRFYADHPSINTTEIFSVGNTDGNVRVANSIYATAFIYNSDETLKQNIAPIQGSLNKVRALNGYTFNWKKDGKADVGLVAQQVETVFPELVHTDTTTGLKSVQYGNLVAPLIEAVKELANSFESLATRVFNTEVRQTELERQNELQAQQIAELQRQINELKNK